MRVKKYFKIYIGFLLISLSACQKPIILKMSNIEKEDYNCEFSVNSKIYYGDIDSLKNSLEREIYKKSNRCKCDTVYMDIDDIFLMRDKVKGVIWGICKSNKLELEKDKKK